MLASAAVYAMLTEKYHRHPCQRRLASDTNRLVNFGFACAYSIYSRFPSPAVTLSALGYSSYRP